MFIKNALLAIAAIALAATQVTTAEECIFRLDEGNFGDWDNPDNWTCLHVPAANDTAVIPDGLICLIENDDAQALSIEVQTGGVLNIYGYTLQLGDSEDLTESTIEFAASVGLDDGVIEIQAGGVTLTGDGLVVGTGQITQASTDAGLAVVVGDMTFQGSLTFLTDIAVNLLYTTVTFVAESGDEMSFGSASSGDPIVSLALTGPTTFEVDGGSITFGKAGFGQSNCQANLTDGGMEFTALCIGADDTDFTFDISGGALTVDTDLSAKHITFSGGSIIVAASTSATFAP